MNENTFIKFWPEQASHYAGQVDWLVATFTGMMLLFVLPVFVCLLVFSFRYRQGTKVPRDHRSIGNHKIEITWIALPFLGAMVLFVLSSRLYYVSRTPPADAMEIHVVAKQWMWKFQHPGGQREINALHVPVGRPVKLNLISQDAIHSLYFPVMRNKQDALPGTYTHMWFEANKPGTFEGKCAEYCGTDHSTMRVKLVVLKPEEYERWLEESGTSKSLARQGEGLFRQFGCSGCHVDRPDGALVHAPPLSGLYGRAVALADGGKVIADSGYIRDSILLPQKQITAGYEPIMPTFSNVLDEEAVLRLVAYIKSLATPQQNGDAQ
ncbi:MULTISPECIES: cytochrome c oxidase subunit II [Pseudomonas]|uniref:cytochrome c oxidase subunit II n=1 Tax=Pseudomonas TaxID=286 RepID=UPI0007320607|nr:cytochrome c oxidase subunit II [Pseudomonas fluorescens]